MIEYPNRDGWPEELVASLWCMQRATTYLALLHERTTDTLLKNDYWAGRLKEAEERAPIAINNFEELKEAYENAKK